MHQAVNLSDNIDASVTNVWGRVRFLIISQALKTNMPYMFKYLNHSKPALLERHNYINSSCSFTSVEISMLLFATFWGILEFAVMCDV